jgi:hypothetical protein
LNPCPPSRTNVRSATDLVVVQDGRIIPPVGCGFLAELRSLAAVGDDASMSEALERIAERVETLLRADG